MKFIGVPALTLLTSTSSAFSIVSRSSLSCVSQISHHFMTVTTKPEVDRTIRVLAIHGSGGNQSEFVNKLAPIETSLQLHNTNVEWIAMDGPIPNGDGYSWWTYGPGERSSTAKEYVGMEDSSTMILKAIEQWNPDLVVAHSQGAILLAALLALRRIPAHATLGYLLNGVAWPNPYSKELEQLTLEPAPRIMLVMGEQDTINPIDGQDRVRMCLEKAGADVTICKHAGGHSIPATDHAFIETFNNWINI